MDVVLSWFADHPLTLLIIVPMFFALAGLIVGRFKPESVRLVALAGALLEALLAAAVTYGFVTTDQATAEYIAAPDALGIWSLQADGLSIPLIALTGLLGVVAILASWKTEKAPGAHHAMLLILTAATMGVFLAADLVLFYVFWEAVLIPMFFLIGRWGHERGRHAALKFFLYTFLGSAFMLVGLMVIILHTGVTSIGGCYANGLLLGTPEAVAVQPLVFWLLAAGFLVKVPVVPLHTWLPDAHVEAPTAGSIMLAGVLLKMGGYGMLRLAIPFAPEGYLDAMPWLAGLGLIGILYGSLTAMAQTDLKRLVAYSSVAHMGFVVLALGVGTGAAIGAAMLTMVSHGVVSALLFLLVGMLYDRTHTREIERFGGLMRVVPAWGMAFSFGMLASLGLPGLSGFPGELLTLIEAFGPYGAWLLVALLGLVISAGYHLWTIRRVNHGGGSAWRGLPDLDIRERAAVLMLAATIVALGVWPQAVLGLTTRVGEVIGGILGMVS